MSAPSLGPRQLLTAAHQLFCRGASHPQAGQACVSCHDASTPGSPCCDTILLHIKPCSLKLTSGSGLCPVHLAGGSFILCFFLTVQEGNYHTSKLEKNVPQFCHNGSSARLTCYDALSPPGNQPQSHMKPCPSAVWKLTASSWLCRRGSITPPSWRRMCTPTLS